MTTAPERIVIASRESALALWQARHIQAQLAQLYPAADIFILGMTTEGDRRPEVSLQQVGGKGLFVKELEEALLDGRADLAVHSLKDVPMTLAPEFALAAIGERADPRDAFVSRRYRNPAEVPPGSRIGTSSLRRASQLRARYPALKVEPLRGNVPTRLTQLDRGDYEGIVVAAAGLKRLGLEDRITLIFTPEESVPAAGQGALALECCTERSDIKAWLAPLNHVATAACVAAERSFSRSLGGSCNVPLGAYSELTGTRLRLRGLVAQPDGARVVRGEADGALDAPEALGRSLAATLEAQGAGDILAALAKAGVP